MAVEFIYYSTQILQLSNSIKQFSIVVVQVSTADMLKRYSWIFFPYFY